MKLFKDLTPEEESRFRQWARASYKVFGPIDGVWHPVVQDECVKMNRETGYRPAEANPRRESEEY